MIDGRNAFYTQNCVGGYRTAGWVPGSRDAAGHDQNRAGRGSGGPSALGHRARRAARPIHALHANLFDHRASVEVAGYQRELAMDARVLEGRLSRCQGRTRRPHLLRLLVRTGPGLLDRIRCRMPNRRRCHSRRRHGEPAAPGDDRRRRATVVLHADLCASAGRSRRERTAGRRSLPDSTVRAVIVAGEPGGGIPATRDRIERAWGARVYDQHGLTEVGPVSFECFEQPGALHVNENEFICEVVDPATLESVADGHPGELLITNLGRTGSPVIRYRTGDVVVRRSERCACGRTFARLDGVIIARTDDMVNIRGVTFIPQPSSRCFAFRRGRRVPLTVSRRALRSLAWRWNRRRRAIRGDHDEDHAAAARCTRFSIQVVRPRCSV